MKIRMCGMTSIETKPPEKRRANIKKIDVLTYIHETFVQLGHEVDWRRIDVGEDLSGYDLLFLSWGGVLSLNAKPGALGVLWAAAQPIPQIIYWTDWQFRSQLSHMKTLSTKPHYLSKPGLSGAEFYYDTDPQELIQEHAEVILGSCAEMIQPWTRNDRLAVCPMYSWGDHATVLHEIPCGRERITYLDPSPKVLDEIVFPALQRHPPDIQQRETWTLPSLMPHGDWVERQNLTWPVTYFGSRKMKAERLKTEEEVLGQIMVREGVLSPKYHHSGSGWWRSRFLYAAATARVLAGDPAEGAALGPAYGLSPAEMEVLPVSERDDLAYAQAESLLPTLWTNERWTEAVRDLPRWVGL